MNQPTVPALQAFAVQFDGVDFGQIMLASDADRRVLDQLMSHLAQARETAYMRHSLTVHFQDGTSRTVHTASGADANVLRDFCQDANASAQRAVDRFAAATVPLMLKFRSGLAKPVRMLSADDMTHLEAWLNEQAEAQQVRPVTVMAMPSRTVSTEVERDANGEIVRTTSQEATVPPRG